MRQGFRRVVPALLLLVVGSYIAWDQVERRALARDIDAIAARGEPIAVADVATGADTPERHDAARIYAAATQRVRAMPNEHTFRLSRLDVDSTVGPPLDVAELEKIYRPDAAALQLLDQATPLDFNGFGDVAPDWSEGSLTTLGALAALRADLFAARGKGDDAARALVPCIRLLRVASQFSRYILTNRIMGSARILLRRAAPGAEALQAMQTALAQLPDTDGLEREALMQRARYIDEISSPKLSLGDAILARIVRPWLSRQQRHGLSSYDEALALAREPWPGKFVSGQALEAKYRASFERMRSGGVLGRLVPPEGIGVLSSGGALFSGRELAARRVILTTLAIERYRRAHAGAIPPSFASLVPEYLPALPLDPFTGDPLLYSPTMESYSVYSVDGNLKNDGGKFYGFGSRGQQAPRSMRDAYDLGIAVAVRN